MGSHDRGFQALLQRLHHARHFLATLVPTNLEAMDLVASQSENNPPLVLDFRPSLQIHRDVPDCFGSPRRVGRDGSSDLVERQENIHTGTQA
jgi:hypothetical protein